MLGKNFFFSLASTFFATALKETNIFFSWLHNHSRGGLRLQVSLSSSQCALLLLKNAVLFPELSFHFPELSFYFLELPFVFQKCLFISRKILIVFQNCCLVFQKCFLFIYCALLFPSIIFFQADCSFSLFPAHAA